jgi:polyisoprenoid-binding protein YceI
MKKILLIAAIIASTVFTSKAQTYYCVNGDVKFFGTSPATDVEAESKKLAGALNLQNMKFAFKVNMKSFDFPNKEMQNHYNEKYLETDKFQNALFTGTINDKIDLKNDGTYKVTCSGKFNCHGVEKDKNIIVNITVKGGNIITDSEFYINLKEYNIEVPTLVFAKIGENIKVNVHCDMTVKK